jgi:hypothetical protein
MTTRGTVIPRTFEDRFALRPAKTIGIPGRGISGTAFAGDARMPAQQIESSEPRDRHEGPEPAQEVGPGPARLDAIAEVLTDLSKQYDAALKAMRRADLHLVKAARMLRDSLCPSSVARAHRGVK